MTKYAVMEYREGSCLGYANVSWARYKRLAQWPQGLVGASEILSDRTLKRLRLEPDTTIWLGEEDAPH